MPYMHHVWRPRIKTNRANLGHASSSQASVDPSTVDADKHTKINGGPLGVCMIIEVRTIIILLWLYSLKQLLHINPQKIKMKAPNLD